MLSHRKSTSLCSMAGTRQLARSFQQGLLALLAQNGWCVKRARQTCGEPQLLCDCDSSFMVSIPNCLGMKEGSPVAARNDDHLYFWQNLERSEQAEFSPRSTSYHSSRSVTRPVRDTAPGVQRSMWDQICRMTKSCSM